MTNIVDLAFPVIGTSIPADHGYLLYSAISRLIGDTGPNWFHESEHVGLLPIRGVYQPDGRLLLGSDSHFVIRADISLVPGALAIAGKNLPIAESQVRAGAPVVRALVPSAAVRARIVTTKNGDEEARFDEEVARQLAAIGVRGVCQRGRRRIISIRSKKVVGHELTITGLDADESLRLLELGVGGRRKMGCGVFNPVREP